MTKEKLDIGRRVYERQLTAKEAAEESGVTLQAVCLYARECMRSIGGRAPSQGNQEGRAERRLQVDDEGGAHQRADAQGHRGRPRKKGYAVKGGGKAKEFISIKDASSR